MVSFFFELYLTGKENTDIGINFFLFVVNTFQILQLSNENYLNKNTNTVSRF